MSVNGYVLITSILIILSDLIINIIPEKKYKDSRIGFIFDDRITGMYIMILINLIAVGYVILFSLPDEMTVVLWAFVLEIVTNLFYGLKLYTSGVVGWFRSFLNNRYDF